MKNVILGTLSLCLGLKFKKDLVKSILTENNMDVLAVQESELEPDTDMNLVSIPGYIYANLVNFFLRFILRCPYPWIRW